MSSYAEVAVLLPVEKTLTYSIPEDMTDRLRVGSCVMVPLGSRKVPGFVTGITGVHGMKDAERIKDVSRVRGEAPAFTESLLHLYRWASQYYLSPMGEVLKAALPLPPVRPPSSIRGREGTRHPLPPVTRSPGAPLQGLDAVLTSLKDRTFTPFLLWSTAADRLTIYEKLLDSLMPDGTQALILFPKISRADLFVRCLRRTWGDRAALVHDDLAAGRAWREWSAALGGPARVVVGSRSAVFAPPEEPRLIIIDEEQDTGYREERRPRYNARDVGLMRGKLCSSTVVLGTTIPSVETYHQVQEGRYQRIHTAVPPLPPVTIVDMRGENRACLSGPLQDALRETYGKGQAVFFLNRRGFAVSLFCFDCGYVPRCPGCGLPLTYHAHESVLRCHSCNLSVPSEDTCSKCGGHRLGSSGVGTQQVEQEVKRILPGARVFRADRDTLKTRGSAPGAGEADIIVGTQALLDLPLPRARCVGIVSIDSVLNLPDFRGSERAFHLLVRLSALGERVFVQTYLPSHPCLSALAENNPDSFYINELQVRRDLGYPPYSRLTAIHITAREKNDAVKTAEHLARVAGRSAGKASVRVLGPAPAFRERYRDGYAWQILLKGRTSKAIHDVAREIRDAGRTVKSGIEVRLDFDP